MSKYRSIQSRCAASGVMILSILVVGVHPGMARDDLPIVFHYCIFLDQPGEECDICGHPVEVKPTMTLSLRSTVPLEDNCDSLPFFIDAWVTGSGMSYNFGVLGSPAIPGDWFDPGSDAFSGSILLQGVPLGETEWGQFDQEDTLIARPDDPFNACYPPSSTEVTVEIEIIALSLESTEPITITYGDQNPEDWNVVVDLSEIAPPPSTLTAIKTHSNGGTFTTVLNVQPRFTFTKVGDPGEVRVLDAGGEVNPVVTLVSGASPWVHDADELACSAFRPGFDDPDAECELVNGACCDASFFGGNCRDCMAASECSDTGDRWIQGVTCEDAQFDPPCPDLCCESRDVCTNRTRGECEAIPGAWLPGKVCEGDCVPDECHLCFPLYPCTGAEGDCFSAHPEPGCEDPICCDRVCAWDGFCCDFEWDENCVPVAHDLCRGACCDIVASTCADDLTEPECVASGGSFQGVGTSCALTCCGEIIPTVSQWGIVVMTLLVLIAGTLVLAKHRPVTT
ncbi:MAG: hypothetical protein WBE26_03810 [Phycisphaerae bacterium]